MSDSVAARLGEDVSWEGLRRFRDEHGISGNQLVAFMSGSIDARLGKDVICGGLRRCRDEHGTSGKQLATFVATALPLDQARTRFGKACAGCVLSTTFLASSL